MQSPVSYRKQFMLVILIPSLVVLILQSREKDLGIWLQTNPWIPPDKIGAGMTSTLRVVDPDPALAGERPQHDN